MGARLVGGLPEVRRTISALEAPTGTRRAFSASQVQCVRLAAPRPVDGVSKGTPERAVLCWAGFFVP